MQALDPAVKLLYYLSVPSQLFLLLTLQKFNLTAHGADKQEQIGQMHAQLLLYLTFDIGATFFLFASLFHLVVPYEDDDDDFYLTTLSSLNHEIMILFSSCAHNPLHISLVVTIRISLFYN